jgi:thiol-disulfide isomerase/thioredoxin
MIERLVMVAILAVLAVIVYQWYLRRQLAHIATQVHIDPILQGIQTGLPTIVYFTTPNCIPCKTQQQAILQKLCEAQEIQVVQIDATEQPETADRWGVMTAPTTFVLDGNLQPKAVNFGVTNEHQLLKQINEAMQVA